MKVLNERKRIDDVVISDAGSAFYVCSQATEIKGKQRYITSSSQAEMGFTIPACIGAAFAKDGQVIGVTGDGSFMMNLQELQTIAHYNLPIKLLYGTMMVIFLSVPHRRSSLREERLEPMLRVVYPFQTSVKW